MRMVAAVAKRGTLGFMLVLLMASVPLWLIFRASTDVSIYARYLEAFSRSFTFPPDYPPAALGVFALGSVPPVLQFNVIFAAWMVVFVTAGRIFIERWISSEAARTYSLLLIAGCAGTVLVRFDAAPAVLTVLALVAMEKKRWALCALAIGVATALKLYPAVLLPVILVVRLKDDTVPGRLDETSRRWRDIAVMGAVFVIVVGIGMILPAIISSQVNHSPSFLAGEMARPIAIGSIPGTILWLTHLAGVPLATGFSYGSVNYYSPLGGPLLIGSVILTLGGLLCTYWGLWRGAFNGRQAFLLAVGILILTSKVFSPQYLIWLVPLVAIAAKLSLDWILVAVLTLLEYPFVFSVALMVLPPISGLSLVLPLLLALRNLALVVAVGRFAANAARNSAPGIKGPLWSRRSPSGIVSPG